MDTPKYKVAANHIITMRYPESGGVAPIARADTQALAQMIADALTERHADHAALCRKLLAALIETRDAANILMEQNGFTYARRDSYIGWRTRTDAVIREAQEALK